LKTGKINSRKTIKFYKKASFGMWRFVGVSLPAFRSSCALHQYGMFVYRSHCQTTNS